MLRRRGPSIFRHSGVLQDAGASFIQTVTIETSGFLLRNSAIFSAMTLATSGLAKFIDSGFRPSADTPTGETSDTVAE